MPNPVIGAPQPLRISVDDADFADRTAQYVCDFFTSLQIRGGRPQPNQWTILAAFLSYTGPQADDTAGTLEILTFGLGNKCVSNPLRREQQVVDMHAEVLARRELEALLLEGVGALRTTEESDASYNQRSAFAAQTLLNLGSRRSDLYLYTSHVPCGSASNAAHLERLDKEDELMKRVLDHGSSDSEVRGESSFRADRELEIPPLTKKPSRGDAIPTSCYSCSDKLSRYQVLGLQGGRLSSCFEENGWPPLRMSGLIVGEDFSDGRGLRMLFGGTIVTDTEIPRSYSRMTDGICEVFAEQCDSATALFRDTLDGVVRDFRIFRTNWIFAYSRSRVTALACDRAGLAQDAATIFQGLSEVERARLRTLPLPIVRDTLVPQPPVSTFPLSCSWRVGQCVEILGPAGVLNGSKRSKTTGDFEKTSRLCRKRLQEPYDEIIIPGDGAAAYGKGKGSPMWRLVSSRMEARGPWKDWHRSRVCDL